MENRLIQKNPNPVKSRNSLRINTRFSMLVVVRVVGAMMQAATLIVVARNVEIHEFGLYSTALAIGAIILGLLSFGLPTRVLTLAKEKNDLVAAAIATTCAAALLSAISIVLFGSVALGGADWWLISAAAYIASEMIANLTQNILFGASRIRGAEVTMVMRRAIPLLSITVCAFLDPTYIFESAAAGFIVTAVISLVVVGRWKWNGWNFRSVLGGSVQYWLSNLWSMLQQLDVVIVSALVGPGAAGAYSAAFRLASPVHIVTSSMVSLLLPKLSQTESDLQRIAIGNKYQGLGFGYGGLIILASPAAMFVGPLLYGHQFSQYGYVFMILLINSALSVFNQLFMTRHYAEGLASRVSKYGAFSTLIGLFLIFTGCLYFGIKGAAIGTLSIQLILGLFLAFSWRAVSRKMNLGSQ